MATRQATQPFMVKALQNYKGKGKDELSFKKGTLIRVSFTNEEDMKYYGETGGKTGWFPYFYVKSMNISMQQPTSPSGVKPAAAGSISSSAKSKTLDKVSEKKRNSLSISGPVPVAQTVGSPSLAAASLPPPVFSTPRENAAPPPLIAAQSMGSIATPGTKKDQRKSLKKGQSTVSGNVLPKNMDQSYVFKSGMLTKSAGAGKKGWKKRWFVLRSDSLTYYKSAVDTKPLGKIPLRQIVSVAVEAGQKPYEICFSVNTKKSVVLVAAATIDERDEWMDCIKSTRKGGKVPVSAPAAKTPAPANEGKAAPVTNENASKEKDDKEQEKEKEKQGAMRLNKKKASQILLENISAGHENANNGNGNNENNNAPPVASRAGRPTLSAVGKKSGANEIAAQHLAIIASESNKPAEDDLSKQVEGLQLDDAQENPAAVAAPSAPAVELKGKKVRAKYDYVGRTDTEFTFRVNEEWILIETLPNGWGKGYMNGRIGHFPVAYVEILSAEEVSANPSQATTKQATAAATNNTNSNKTSSGNASSTTTSTPTASNSQLNANNSRDKIRKKQMVGNYQLGECLGKGAYGQVFRGIDVATGRMVAIKEVALDKIPKEELNGTKAELELLQRLDHVNIVKYNGFISENESMFIVLEFVEGGSLEVILKKFGSVPESLVVRYVCQVLQGLDYLHGQGVIHRDIKCGNILITKEGIVKLADFGIATKLGEGTKGQAPGSPYWMAPEVIQMEEPVTPAADIWSLGCTVYELLTGHPPNFELNPMQAMFSIVENPPPPLPEDISSSLRSFLELCFRKNPLERPTAKELLSHRMLRDDDEEEGAEAEGELESDSGDVTLPTSEKMGTVSSINDSSESAENDEDNEDQQLSEEDGDKTEYRKWEREVNELCVWFEKSMDKENIRHIIKFRKALRKKKKELRAVHKDDDEYKPLFLRIRKLNYRCEDNFGEHIPMDSESDSEEEFNDDSEFEEEEEGEFDDDFGRF